jgi:hypothetical protein
LGLSEVQTVPSAPEAGTFDLRGNSPQEPEPVRPLAHRYQTIRLDDGSRVNREVYARFCESPGVKFPRATHPGPYCREAKARAGQSGVAIGRALAGPTPADVKAGIDAMVTHSERLAALAPPELREEYRVLLEEWRHTREAVERAGWSREEAGRQIESGLQNEKHLQAIGEIAGYWSTHCE